MINLECNTFWFKIYMAGNFDVASQTCRKFCIDNNLCVNIFKTDYIYRCGEEPGFCIEVINYPKYPEKENDVFVLVKKLAQEVLIDCCQKSYSIVGINKTYFYSREDEFKR